MPSRETSRLGVTYAFSEELIWIEELTKSIISNNAENVLRIEN